MLHRNTHFEKAVEKQRFPEAIANKTVTAFSKLYENLGLHFSICTRTCNLETFLEREVEGQEKKHMLLFSLTLQYI